MHLFRQEDKSTKMFGIRIAQNEELGAGLSLLQLSQLYYGNFSRRLEAYRGHDKTEAVVYGHKHVVYGIEAGQIRRFHHDRAAYCSRYRHTVASDPDPSTDPPKDR